MSKTTDEWREIFREKNKRRRQFRKIPSMRKDYREMGRLLAARLWTGGKRPTE